MTLADKHLRAVWHAAILAVYADRDGLTPLERAWVQDAARWKAGRSRARRESRLERRRVPEHLRYRPRPRLEGLTGTALREAIRASVRELAARRAA